MNQARYSSWTSTKSEGIGTCTDCAGTVPFWFGYRPPTMSARFRLDAIRKEAWSFYRTISGVRLCWELEEPKGPKRRACLMHHFLSPCPLGVGTLPARFSQLACGGGSSCLCAAPLPKPRPLRVRPQDVDHAPVALCDQAQLLQPPVPIGIAFSAWIWEALPQVGAHVL